ncbi:EAL domain-containing protein [Sulfurimonas autotrophica]|uniref:Diguanylate cyclase/phosphodiesterase with PAS/PAC sensor(S) n=1 Tax=Sulfurimonas autotrophica (strain ATCC BAA-671 / DSM 16294 / JCM 11897 / OK10) TaxID=563040 RepID=E0URG9_SULAO|nr:EAL domain-containing protein [Sulfurimonas autotrophica]ADN10055.1 diguanylate cyclase/phosphodiesterase with PAS/PAC sensor(s) [Sulfurimonas autotrophica DSM 16294]
MIEKFKQADRTTFILFVFILFVFIMFANGYKIKESMSNFSLQSNKITTLQLIDKELYNFTFTANKFTNYDEVVKQEKKFQQTFKSLSNDLEKYNTDTSALLKDISKNFQKKVEDLEYFKAQNSALINSSHFLFDLHTTISDAPEISLQAKNLTNETLFYILRYASSDYIDKKSIDKKLNKLKIITHNEKSQYLYTFYRHSKVMLQTLQSLKEVSQEIQANPLYEQIKALKLHIIHDYERNLQHQTWLVGTFFLFTVFILFALILSHLESNKTKKELLAFKYAIEHSDNIVVMTDAEKKIVYVNETFEKATGYKAQEVLGQNPRILKSKPQDENIYKELNTKLAKGEKWEGQFINKRKDGTLLYEKASIVPIFLQGKLVNYIALKLDITEYIEQNKKLAQAATVFENTEEVIIIADVEGKVVSVNTAFTNIYGYTLEEIKGKNLSFLHSGVQEKSFYKDTWNQLIEYGIWKGKFVNKTKSGEIIPVWTTIKKITDSKGDVVNYIIVQTDLRELETSQAKADYLAYHDPLTGLYNRVNFEEYLKHALVVAHRNTSLLAILFIDLDRFKVINDTLGHDIGDEVLKAVASRLKTTLRESDFISRWGGDEFVVILENLASASDAAIIASNIIENLEEPINVAQHSLITTASIGIALYPENGEDSHTLIKHADSAMYLTKETGKNNFRYYTKELSEGIQHRLDIDMALRSALQNNELYMVFQPQYKLSTKTIHSAEALIRWQNPTLGNVPPDEFIPVAEENGTIIQLGYFVFEESCKAFKKMKHANSQIKYIAINVSSLQFKEAHLLETFLAIATRHNVKPHEIEIEITERFIMEHTIANMNILQNFRNHGFKISIDDFGTGYSSMSYLKQLPTDTIKIDKSFVDDIAHGSSDNVIIEAIIALSKTLGYVIVAEGIETQDQENFLSKANCDLGQGYLFSRPVTCKEIIENFRV